MNFSYLSTPTSAALPQHSNFRFIESRYAHDDEPGKGEETQDGALVEERMREAQGARWAKAKRRREAQGHCLHPIAGAHGEGARSDRDKVFGWEKKPPERLEAGHRLRGPAPQLQFHRIVFDGSTYRRRLHRGSNRNAFPWYLRETFNQYEENPMRKVYSKLPPLSDEAKAMLDKAVAQPEAQRVEQEAKERIANLPPTGEEPAIVLKS